MTAGAGGFWVYKPKFSIATTNGVALATPTGLSGLSVFGGAGSIPNGTTYNYKIVACLDGAGQLRSASSAQLNLTQTLSPGAFSVTWSVVTGARCYKVYRSDGSGFKLLTIVFTNTVIDWGQVLPAGGVSIVGDTLPIGGVLAQSSYVVDMAPAYNPADDRWFQRSKASVDSVVYQDLSDVAAMQSFKRSMIAKEFGVRAMVAMTFRVVGGSVEEDDLAAIYGAKLSFPDGPSSVGAQVFFSLASPRGLQSFKEVRIDGNFTRTPSIANKNALNVMQWQIMVIDPLPIVPAFGAVDGSGLW